MAALLLTRMAAAVALVPVLVLVLAMLQTMVVRSRGEARLPSGSDARECR
jgi:hypothetical protein